MGISMNKTILLLLFLIAVAVAESDHGDNDHDDHEHGACGKFSPERMLTHKLRHCDKAARDEKAPVSPKCCKSLEEVSIPCLRAIFSSDAFKDVGINPEVAATIPERCHFVKPPVTTSHH